MKRFLCDLEKKSCEEMIVKSYYLHTTGKVACAHRHVMKNHFLISNF